MIGPVKELFFRLRTERKGRFVRGLTLHTSESPSRMSRSTWPCRHVTPCHVSLHGSVVGFHEERELLWSEEQERLKERRAERSGF